MSQKLMASKRLKKELSEIKKSPPVEMSIGPIGDNMFKWEGILYGPSESPYEGGMFKFTVDFPDTYPMKPPVVKFVTQIFHPNISEKGDICVDILKNHWTSVYTISQVMLSISSLLTDPNPTSALNSESARLYMNDRIAYEKEVRKWVNKYANAEQLGK